MGNARRAAVLNSPSARVYGESVFGVLLGALDTFFVGFLIAVCFNQ